MSGNPLPWIVLASIVAASLVWKGYVKLPSARAASPTTGTANKAMAPESSVTYGDASPSEAYLLERLDSHTLGVYFAVVKRREVEANLAHQIALDAGNAIEATFTAPFSPPAPAPGPDPNQAGVKPPQ